MLSDPEAGRGAASAGAPQSNLLFVSQDKGMQEPSPICIHMAGEPSSAAAIWWPLKGSPGHICHKLHWPWAALGKCGLRATLPSSRVPRLSVSLCLESTSTGLRLTNLFCRLWWERLLPWSYLPAVSSSAGTTVLCLCCYRTQEP